MDVVHIAGHIRVTQEMADDIKRVHQAMSRPVSREEYEAWLAEPDDDDNGPMSDEDIIERLRFWANQDRAHYEARGEGEENHCQTCAFVRDMDEAIAEIERLRQSDGGGA